MPAAVTVASVASSALAASLSAPRCPPRRPYYRKVNYTADWGFLLTDIVCVDPGGALESQKLASAEVREPAPPDV